MLDAPGVTKLLQVGVSATCAPGRSRNDSSGRAQGMEADAKAFLNLDREAVGRAVTDTRWEELLMVLRRLLGYAAERGYGHQPLLEQLFNGQLFIEYTAFMVVARRALRVGMGRNGPWARLTRGRRRRTSEFSTAAGELGALARLADLAVRFLPPAERERGRAYVARDPDGGSAQHASWRSAAARRRGALTRRRGRPCCTGACAAGAGAAVRPALAPAPLAGVAPAGG